MLSENDVWKILEAYSKENTLVQNQIDSYNDFVNFGMAEIVEQDSTISLPNYTIKFNHICLAPPQVIEEDRNLHCVYPNDARIRDLNYDSAILCDITETYTEGDIIESKTYNKIVIGRMPVMLKSCICNLSKLNEDEIVQKGECPNDLGGYFIIKGNERVLVGQLRTVYNQIFVLSQKSNEKYKWVAETRSMSEETGHSVLLKGMIGNDDRTIVFSLPYIKEPIPVGVVFKALGFTEDEIPKIIGLDNEKSNKYIRYIRRDSSFCETKEDSLSFISRFAMHVITESKEKDYARQVVETEMLPHLGITGTNREKAFFLGKMIKKLIYTHIGERTEDDRDNFTNKRVDIAGSLLYDIFRNLYKKYLQFIHLRLQKRKQRPDILSVLSGIKSITQGLHRCLATGNWGIQKNASYVKTGVSQILDRMTYCATLSHLRRVLIPMGKEGKNVAMRQIHSSSFGFICPCECFDPETPILLWNGDVKKASEIKVGEYLIDYNGLKTKVKSTTSGRKKMYRITHNNKYFSDYTVTDNHILTLKSTLHKKFVNKTTVIYLDKNSISYVFKIFDSEKEAIKFVNDENDPFIDIAISDYLNLPPFIKNTFKMSKCETVFWDKVITENDPYEYGKTVKTQIKPEYKINDFKTRIAVLSGFLDHNEIKVLQDNEILISKSSEHLQLLKDILFIFQSCGFLACIERSQNSENLNLYVKGNLKKLMCETHNFKQIENDLLLCEFKLEKLQINNFVGWQLEGSGRFLLSDFTITHNTPEGQKIGVVLNYALTTKITKKVSKILVRTILEKCKTITFNDKMDLNLIKDYTAVYLNNILIGFSQYPEDTLNEIKNKRTKGLLDKEVSIFYDNIDDEIKVFCDEGRFSRPLFKTTENNQLAIKAQDKYDWSSLVKKEKIQYVDAGEIENCVLAMTPDILKIQRGDFCEIHPSTMLGIMAAMIPFPDHSQSPRNCYQASMGKQALGMPILSYNLRSDTLLHILHYPQRPLVCTKASEIFKINEMPSGINAIVAIACYTGFNQEDSVIMNLSSIQRGLFCLTSLFTIDCFEKKRDTYSFEEICFPPETTVNLKEGQKGFFQRKNGNYSLLDSNGIIKPRERFENGQWVGPATVVKKGDVLVGKVIVSGNKSSEESRTDASLIVQPGEEGVIDRVYISITPNGYKLVKVVIRISRDPTIGDKVASRAAQKGTTGGIYRQEDMPFTASGIVPDIIINPLCLAGDSVVSLGGGNVDYINNIVERKEEEVLTVNPSTFVSHLTGIHSPFKTKTNRKVVKVSTISGREIVCTDDHLFLTANREWVKAIDLQPEIDTLLISHTIKPLSQEGMLPIFDFKHNIYKINLTIDEKTLQILARILGIIESDGHLSIRNAETLTFRTIFYLTSEKDSINLRNDIFSLGFPEPTLKVVETAKNIIHRVEGSPSLGFLLFKMGAHTGRKSEAQKRFPEWLFRASLEVRRQFLCGFQSGNGSSIFYDKKIKIKPTICTSKNKVLDHHIAYMNGLKKLFADFEIKTTIQFRNPKDVNSKEICLYISNKLKNLETYSDTIYYSYADIKNKQSKMCIEYLKTINRTEKDFITFENFKILDKGDCVGIFVKNVEEIEYTDFVYDFATVSENHSFVANSIVVHNCIPSRMTINQLVETALGKECAIFGKYEDCTPFTSNSINVADKLVKRLEDNLQHFGHQKQGWERMYNGMTGEMIEADIYIGPTYYQRLKHMVDDKMHARAGGHVTMLTRQPLEGRSKDGGLRFGEMERDCMIAHGNSAMLRERLFLVSDPFQVCVCDKCGIITSKKTECQNCKSDSISECNIPYASKLLHQELTAMGLKINIKSDKLF